MQAVVISGVGMEPAMLHGGWERQVISIVETRGVVLHNLNITAGKAV